ncbi:MAG: serine/threonine protein kinase [Phormidesmis sp.]
MLINNRYQVIRTLGEGGFGQAYLATDRQMPSQRKCAIKQLKPMNASPQTYQLVQARFQREAAILEKLGEDHPQIPRLYAYFSENRQFYLVQEWIDGITLESLVVQQGLQSEAVIRSILAALLPVMDFIHSQGIIHRDIKPDNIILRAGSQQPVLIDFGAVRETMATVMGSQSSPKSSIVIGTPGFMPPEQAAGRPIPSSDLYSLGLVAIFLLTGRLPQSFETDAQTGEIIWQTSAQSASAEFVAFLDRAVQSHPRDRYPSAQAMLSSLLALPKAAATVPQPVMPIAQSAVSNNLSVPPQYYPSAAESTLKTVAVAPAQPASSVSNQTSDLIPNQTLQNTLIHSTNDSNSANDSNLSSSTGYLNNNANRSTPVKRLSPLVIGLAVVAVVGSAIAGNLFINRSPSETTTQAIAPAPTKTKDSKSDSAKAVEDSQTKPEDNAFEEPAASTEETTEYAADSAEQPSQAAGDQVTLGSSSGQIPVYESPSFSAASPQYGVSGDRVSILQQSEGDDGNLWYRVRFSSGAEGWVAQAYADPSSYAPDGGTAPAASSSAPPPAAPETAASSPPPKASANSSSATSSPQLVGGAGAQVDVYSAPSADASSPHYGLGGDRVTVLNSTQGADGSTWYQVQFDSGASGWVSGDAVKNP